MDAVEVGVHPVAVGVAKRFDRQSVPGGDRFAAVFDVQVLGGGLEVALIRHPIWWVVVAHLYLSGEAVFGDQALEDVGGVAVDETVLPMSGVLVEVERVSVLRQAVEVIGADLDAAVAAAELVEEIDGADLLAHIQRQSLEAVRSVGSAYRR